MREEMIKGKNALSSIGFGSAAVTFLWAVALMVGDWMGKLDEPLSEREWMNAFVMVLGGLLAAVDRWHAKEPLRLGNGGAGGGGKKKGKSRGFVKVAMLVDVLQIAVGGATIGALTLGAHDVAFAAYLVLLALLVVRAGLSIRRAIAQRTVICDMRASLSNDRGAASPEVLPMVCAFALLVAITIIGACGHTFTGKRQAVYVQPGPPSSVTVRVDDAEVFVGQASGPATFYVRCQEGKVPGYTTDWAVTCVQAAQEVPHGR